MALDPNTTPFDNASPGEDIYRYAHYVKRPAAADINAGEAVTIDANGEFKPVQSVDASASTPSWDDVAGVAYISVSAGEYVTVKTNGGTLARVPAGAASGDTVGTSSGSTDSGAGELSLDGDAYHVVRTKTADDSDGNTQDYAEVLKR